MKIKDSTRTRLTGYVGIIVTTLLTPGGKLISSAMAAAVVVGLVSLNASDQNTKIADAKPTIPADASTIDTGLLGVGGLPMSLPASDMLAPETLASNSNEPLAFVSQDNHAGLTTQSVSSDNLASTNIADASMGGVPTPPATGPRPKIKFVAGFPPNVTPECTPISVIEDAIRKGVDVTDIVICKEEVVTADSRTPALGDEPSDYGAPFLGDAPSTNDPKLLSAPGKVPKDNAPDASPYSPKVAGLAPDISTREIPLLALAAVSEPSTLAMLLLGLMGMASLYRRKISFLA